MLQVDNITVGTYITFIYPMHDTCEFLKITKYHMLRMEQPLFLKLFVKPTILAFVYGCKG